MEWLNEFTPEQWAIIGVVAAVATALATGLSAALAMLWRFADRQRAAWVFFDAGSEWRLANPYGGGDSPPRAWATLANAGDGTALRVRVIGLGCSARTQGEEKTSQMQGFSWRNSTELVPAMRSGDTVHIAIEGEPTEWERAEVVVTWTASPSWLRGRRVERVPLPQVAPRPRGTSLSERGGDDLVPIEQEPKPPTLGEEWKPDLPHKPAGRSVVQRRKLRQQLRRL